MVPTTKLVSVAGNILSVEKSLEYVCLCILQTRTGNQLSKPFKMTIKGFRCYYHDRKFDIEQEK